MTTTYYLSSTNSDFSDGADFTRLLSPTTGTTGTINISVAASATETSYGYTDVGVPGTDGGTGSRSWTVEVRVTSGTADMSAQIFLARVNSSGVVQTGPTQLGTGSLDLSSAGVKTATGSVDLSTFAAGDRLRVGYRITNGNTMKTQSVTIGTNTTDEEVVTPWTISAAAAKLILIGPVGI